MEITDILFQPVDFKTFNFEALKDFLNVDGLVSFLFDSDHYAIFKSFIDRVENHFLLLIHAFMATITHFLYFIRVGPVKILNERREHFCNAQPAYGSDEFLQLVNYEPLSIVYCSHWFNNSLVALEKLWIAPYVLFKFILDKFNQFMGTRFASHTAEVVSF